MDNYKYLKVFYNDILVGTLAKTPDKLVAFEYYSEWIARGFSISPFSLPLQKKVFLPKSKKTFIWPVKGKIISDYGKKGQGQQNDGINILAPLGTEVLASEKGTVVYAHNQLKGYGNLILIHHANGWITTYAHLNKMYVSKGMKVNKGQKIATVGHTGSVKSPQLHFEIRYNTKVVNPKKYLQ